MHTFFYHFKNSNHFKYHYFLDNLFIKFDKIHELRIKSTIEATNYNI